MFGFRGRAEHLKAREFPQLQGCGSNASRSGVNQNPLTFPECRHAMEHFVGGHVIQDQANGFRGIEGVGNRYKSILQEQLCSGYIRRS